jgi:hypothetical protein
MELTEITRHTKLDIALEHLDLALSLYLDGSNYFCVITLAGVADELLGKYVRLQNLKDAATEMAEDMRIVHKVLYNEWPALKDMKYAVNYNKNAVKHMDSADDALVITTVKYEARTMLERAVKNYEKLGLPVNPRVERFWSVLAGREQA